MDHTVNLHHTTLDEYQADAMLTAIYPEQYSFRGLVYCALKLNGEAGEVAEHVGKAMRDDGGVLTEERRQKLILELGDVMWYVANVAKELGVSLNHVAERNMTKLRRRADQGTLRGSGSDR